MKTTVKTSLFFIVLLAAVLIVEAQMIRIKQVNLKQFPEISAIISVESETGKPIPVDTRGLLLYENGKPIQGVRVVPLDSKQLPIYTVVIIDKSGSMKGTPIKKAREAAGKFVEMMRGQDRAAYIEFDTQVKIAAKFTGDPAAVIGKIQKTRVGSDTALLDAVWQGVELFKSVPEDGVKVILVLTDGKENRSTRTLDEVIRKARENQVSVFSVGLGENIDEKMLKKMAGQTEANYYHAPGPDRLADIYRNISLLLHSQLLMRFKTSFPMDDQWHRLRVEVPYMGRVVSGEKPYLSARESRIPTELLKRIRREENRKLARQQRQIERKEKNEHRLIILLSVVLGILILVLIVAMIRRGKGKKRG